VDGECRNDPNGGPFVENPFGTSNSLKIVVTFGTWKDRKAVMKAKRQES
jgi:hypothetical protein